MCLYVSFFFFKQKTAYEMRISDWSSDVCSSDLSRSPARGKDSRRETKAGLQPAFCASSFCDRLASARRRSSAATICRLGSRASQAWRNAGLRKRSFRSASKEGFFRRLVFGEVGWLLRLGCVIEGRFLQRSEE